MSGRIFLMAIFAILLPILLVAPQSNSQLPSKIKADDLAYREYMVNITRQLGVSCASCHNTNNFASPDKLSFKTAKEHIRITQLLIDNGFDGEHGAPKADCYMCHRGKLKPDFKEPFDPMLMQKLKKKKGQDNKAEGKDKGTTPPADEAE